MRTSLLSYLVPLAVMAVPARAHADDQPHDYPACDHQASDSDVQAAKGAFQAGQVSFDEADYQRAITYWEDAYRRDCTAHALLLNLSRAYELSGKKQQAVVALQTYLDRNQAATDKDKIQRRIDVLKTQIAAEQPAQPQTTATPTATSTPTQPTQPPDTGPTPQTGGGKRSPVPLYVAAGGGALALVSLIPYVKASNDVSNYEAKCGGRGNCPKDQPALISQANSALTRQKVWGTLTFVGVGVAAVGIVWYIVQPAKPQTTAASAPPPLPLRPRVTPALGPGFAGLVIDTAF